MPLLINVGLNRKASKDFQSVGVSLNLTAELDQGRLSDPPRLQSEIDRIYGQAEEALERQISAMGTEAEQDAQPAPHAAPQTTRRRPSSQNDHAAPTAASNSEPRSNGFAQRGPVRPATESQMGVSGSGVAKHKPTRSRFGSGIRGKTSGTKSLMDACSIPSSAEIHRVVRNADGPVLAPEVSAKDALCVATKRHKRGGGCADRP
jgi:hypothetical protein